MKKIFIILLLIGTFGSLRSQITSKLNMYRSGDKIVKYQIEYKDLMTSGTDVLWDISDINIINKGYNVFYTTVNDSLGTIACTEHDTRYYYCLRNNILDLNGMENNTTSLKYDIPEIFLKFPMQYKDSIEELYHCSGIYCDKLPFQEYGKYKTTVDSYGKMIMPNGDTLSNVARLHTQKIISSIQDSTPVYNKDSIASHLNTDKRIILTDTYRWYALGYRYPILETIATRNKNDTNVLYSTAFYYPTSEQEIQTYDEENKKERIRILIQNNSNSTSSSTNGGLTYKLYADEANRSMTFDYSLSSKSSFSYGIYTLDGIEMHKNGIQKKSEGSYCEKNRC
jgi:hypothetical protein